MAQARRAIVHLAAAAAFLAVAVAFTWPLPAHYRTHLLGDPAGDTGVYVWNLWIFRHEIIEHGHSPFRTDMLFVPAASVSLGLHNYTILADLIALPLLGLASLVATFNVIQWLSSAANAYAMFLLARYLTGDTAGSLLAGAAFGFSPFLMTRATAHQSLLMVAPLPIFLLLLLKARDSGLCRYAAAAGAALAAAALSDAYYGMFGLLIGAWVLAAGAVTVERTEGDEPAVARALRRVATAAALAASAAIAWILGTGGSEIEVGGARLVLRTLYTPVLVLTLALLVLASRQRRVACRPDVDWRRALPRVTAGLGVCVLLCLPVLYAMARASLAGRYVQPPVNWRSSPPGVDVLALVLPNPNHAAWAWPWLETLPNGYVENVASQSLVALAIIGLARILDPRALPAAWGAFAAFFALLSLGPFIHVAGVNTCVPTPWTILRYVPVLANARSPTRFAVVVTLGTAILFAFALRAVRARSPRPGLVAPAVAALLFFELAPAERRLFSARVPKVYATIAADPRPVAVLELPFGVRSGASSVGDFSAFSMFGQTVHGKPLLGGYLSRVSDKRVAAYRGNPVTDALLRYSSGEAPSPAAAQAARGARKAFLAETRLGYVVVDTRRTPERMQRFVVNTLRLEEIGADPPYDLYAVPAPGYAR